MQIRKYIPGEEPQLWRLYFETIHTVNVGDYTPAQVAAWAPEQIDPENWRRRIASIQPFVCFQGEEILGYADLQPSGLIDHFYVHHAHQRRGVGRLLMERIHTAAADQSLPELHSHVSITAKPFFAAHGFEMVAEQQVEIGDQTLTNFKMKKQL